MQAIPCCGAALTLTAAILTEPYAGLRAQARGLAEAAGLAPAERTIVARPPWGRLPPELWPWPLAAIEPQAFAAPLPDILVGCGGKAAAVLSALRGPRRVIVQHPRRPPRRFDLVVAARHDDLTGPNVLVTRTATHTVTQARLAEAAAVWRPRFDHLPRPLVGVLVGGSNGRFRLGPAEGAALVAGLQDLLNAGAGVAITSSRRTDPVVTAQLAALDPARAWLWDGTGDNPYVGLLACADLIVATCDSVSMVSEAVATAAPVLVVALPGRSARIARFVGGLMADGRVQPFRGRLETWDVSPIDDTPWAAAEMRRRLGF